MKKLLPLIAALCLACSASLAQAATEGKHLTPQQQKMSTCSKQAKAEGKKGDERKAFMKECLSAKKATASHEPAHTAKAAQQEKMKACNKEATGKKGAERKAFMKECLSKA